ncbi:MAG: uncharacterized protein A8A55_3412 [Amphiamblys sp. WSBS2006]|nr:MAG: uncharacterized protein A8A55_3412 [Amphiamblys sp. WSBS2006]
MPVLYLVVPSPGVGREEKSLQKAASCVPFAVGIAESREMAEKIAEKTEKNPSYFVFLAEEKRVNGVCRSAGEASAAGRPVRSVIGVPAEEEEVEQLCQE